MPTPDASPPQFLSPVYRPSDSGVAVVYAGDLIIFGGDQGSEQRVRGTLQLHFDELKARLDASVYVDRETRLRLVTLPEFAHVNLPPGADLAPPAVDDVAISGLPNKEWHPIAINKMVAGNAAAVRRVIIQVAARLTDFPLPASEMDVGAQGHVDFVLPGWTLRLAEVVEEYGQHGPSFIIEATPNGDAVTDEALDLLEDRVFDLLGLIAGAEPGAGPAVGLSESGEIVWAHWGAPRSGRSSWRWCPGGIVDSALPALAQGLSRVAQDTNLEKIVSRGARYWMAANAWGVVLDVKIPVACSGLELLAWTVLQQRQWLSADSLNRLNAGANLRLLLQSMGIPVELPSNFSALMARKKAYQSSWDEGPELLFAVRNDLVHPAKKAAKLDWPSTAELTEAWQLSMWYLELVIIRLLDYQGEHVSRLRQGGFGVDPVPWAS